MEQWNFPSANGLGFQGISNGGVETFKGTLIRSLTREICQNSLDACNGSKPVKLEFFQSVISKSSFPGHSLLKKYMCDAKIYWEERGNRKSIDFFKNACNVLESNNIPVLRISDYNTTGLTGSDDPKENSAWFSMVCSEGVSNKSGSNSGSYGIGKSSIYAASSLRTVFFNTYDIEGKRAAQGVSKLTTFISDNDKKYGSGFFGQLQPNGSTSCCNSIKELDEIKYRHASGTDIFIMGFNVFSNWKDTVIISLLEYFLLAIYNGKLEVKVQDITVSKDNIKFLLDKYKDFPDGCSSAYNYYQVLVSDEPVIENKSLFKNISGTVKLKIAIFKDSLSNRTVLMSRSNGMKLFDKNRISSSIQFSAILTMEGDELSQYFARMEDPTHSNWQPDRYDKESKIKEANKSLKSLYKWIKDTIVKKGTESYGEEIDVKGMEGLLPEFYDLSTNKRKQETLVNKKSKVTINKKKKEIQSINFKTDTQGDSYYEYEGEGVLDKEGDVDTKGVPKKLHSKHKGGEGAPEKGNLDDGNRPIIKFAQINNFKKRIFVTDASENEYTIKLTTNQTIDDCRLQVFISGETTTVDANLLTAKSDGNELKISDNVIHIGKIFKGFSKVVRFTIESDYQCNLEVKLYANKK